MGFLWGLMNGSINVLGSTYLVEQLSFSMILSILTFEFDLFLGLSLIFGALMGYFWGKGKVQ